MEEWIKKSDAIKALNTEARKQFRLDDSYAYVIGTLRNVEDAISNIPSADYPQGEVNAVEVYERESHNLDQGYISLGEFDKRIEPLKHLYYDRPQGEWIDCKELPSTDRNVFIAYGTDNMKSVCIGHYEHDMKLWYEDKNFFAKPIFDAMYWCEVPQFPARMKGADDE